jgi:hypothetical protein
MQKTREPPTVNVKPAPTVENSMRANGVKRTYACIDLLKPETSAAVGASRMWPKSASPKYGRC